MHQQDKAVNRSFLRVLFPNFLSLLRLVFLPVGLYYIKRDAVFQAILVFALIVLTDIGDGMFARKWGSTTRVGMVLDHVVDKLIFVTVTYSLTLFKDFPLWAFYFLVIREVLTVMVGGFLLLRGRRMTPHFIGRIAGITFSVVLLFFFLRLPGRMPLLYLSIMLLIFASFTYMRLYIFSLYKPTPLVSSKRK